MSIFFSLSHVLVLTLLVLYLIFGVVSAEEQASSSEKQTLISPIFTHSCQCCVCFAMDESGSIDASEWNAQVNFVLYLAFVHSLFNSGWSRYSAVAFGTGANLIVPLTPSYAVFQNAVTSYVKGGGGTNIGEGLKACQRTFEGQKCSRKTIVLLSDGFGTALAETVNAIKATGTSIITIGIGSGVNFPLLQEIASDRNCAFRTTYPVLKGFPTVRTTTFSFVSNICVNPLLTRIASKFCRKRALKITSKTRSG